MRKVKRKLNDVTKSEVTGTKMKQTLITSAFKNMKHLETRQKSFKDILNSTVVIEIADSDDEDLDATVESPLDLDETIPYDFTQTTKRKIELDDLSQDETETKLFKVEVKDMNINLTKLNIFRKLLEQVVDDELLEEDATVLEEFLNFEDLYQYFVLKLLMYMRKWYNIQSFLSKIGLYETDDYLTNLYETLSEMTFIDTDYSKEPLEILLNLLDKDAVAEVYKKFRLNKAAKSKKNMIELLLKNLKTQSTLSQLNPQQILRKQINLKLSKMFSLNKRVDQAFQNAFLLATFTNPTLDNIRSYLRHLDELHTDFPDFPVEDYRVFWTRDEFLEFAEAWRYDLAATATMESKNYEELAKIGREAFAKLRGIIAAKDVERSNERFSSTPHLQKFTAEYKYMSVLSSCSIKLLKKQPSDVKEWLEFMNGNCCYENRIGDHYNRLIHIYVEEGNYNKAAQLFIEVFETKVEHLSEVQLYDLRYRWKQLKQTKKAQIEPRYIDRIKSLNIQRAIKIDCVPTCTIDAHTNRSNEQGRKRDYIKYNARGDKIVMTVEDVALDHYIETEQFTSGLHCEGAIIKALFTLHFWDVLYQDYVPGAFIQAIQTVPLDLYSKDFYRHRKVRIDERIANIAAQWTDEVLHEFVVEHWNKYKSKSSYYLNIATVIDTPQMLIDLIGCIGRTVLANIFRRLIDNVRFYQSGMPDLLVWNAAERRCKFVEVKGENDKLATNQKLWLHFLYVSGANVEVCHVYSIGSKRERPQNRIEIL